MDERSILAESRLKSLKRDVVAAVAEYLGTTVFLLMGMGGIQASAISVKAAQEAQGSLAISGVPSVEHLLYISSSMALALLVSAWTFCRISGSVFNPNIAIALLMTGNLKPVRFCLYVVAEVLAGITASGILYAVLPGSLSVDCGLGPNISVWQGLIIETVLTGILAFTILMVAVENHETTHFAPVAIGLTLFATHMFGVSFTGAALNSARAFGPELFAGIKSYHWIYWVGPSLGASLAALIYLLLKKIESDSFSPPQEPTVTVCLSKDSDLEKY